MLFKSFVKFLIFSCVLALCGCDVKSLPVKPTTLESKPKPTQAAMEKTVIVYVRGMDETEGTLKLIESYNAKSDKIFVKYQELPSDSTEYYSQLRLALKNGETRYDVIDMDVIWKAEFAVNNFIVPVDEYVAKDKLDLGAYISSSVEAAKYNGKLYALPRSISTAMLYFRNDIVDKTPATWDELITLSKSIKANGNSAYSYVFAGKESDALVSEALELIYSYGGQILDKNGNLSIKKEETIKGLEKFKEIYTSDFVPEDLYKMTGNAACVSFLEGESALMRNLPYAWALGNKSTSKVYGKFSLAPLPKGEAGSVAMLSGYMSAINANSKYKDEAWDFIKYLSSFEGQKISAIYGGKIPTYSEVLVDQETVFVNPHFTNKSFINAITNAVPRPSTPYFEKFSLLMQTELGDFLNNTQSAEEMLNKIEKGMNSLQRQ